MRLLVQSEYGMTMVELLIALLITGILSVAMFRIYINQHQVWTAQSSVIEMQQNARAAMDELTRQIRMAGYGLPSSLVMLDAYDGNPDSISIRYRVNDNLATLSSAATIYSTLDLAGSDLSHYCAGQQLYIFNPVTETGEFFTVATTDSAAATMTHSTALSDSYPAGSQVLAICQLTYRVDKSDADHPTLIVRVDNGVENAYAEDINDLQINYKLKNGTVVAEPILLEDVRQIGITLTARSADPDAETPSDPYRYRVLHSRVLLRNIGV